jgi:hypothetical protein
LVTVKEGPGGGTNNAVPGGPVTDAYCKSLACHGVAVDPHTRYTTDQENHLLALAAGFLTIPFGSGEVELASNARVAAEIASDARLGKYVLNPALSGGKAGFFEKELGFTSEHAGALGSQLRFNPSTARFQDFSQWGARLDQVQLVRGANGSTAWVRSVYQIDRTGEMAGVPRLITAVPW